MGAGAMLEHHALSRYPAQLLLVEDSEADIRLTREVLREAGFAHVLHVATDGISALQMARDSALFGAAGSPDLVLLDLNLPGKSGYEILLELKSDARLRRVPVVVLSTSCAEADVIACYDAHANCYVSKPVELDDFFELARCIRDFWLKRAVLPTRLAQSSAG